MRFNVLDSGFCGFLDCETEFCREGGEEDGEVGGEENEFEFELLSVSEFWGSTTLIVIGYSVYGFGVKVVTFCVYV